MAVVASRIRRVRLSSPDALLALRDELSSHADSLPVFTLSPRLVAADLVRLEREHRRTPYYDNLCSALVLDPRTPAEVFAHMLRNGVDPNVLATSSYTPLAIVRRLVRSRSRFVRDHARINLASRVRRHSRARS